MPSIERKIPGTFAPVPGGYSRKISENMTEFIPSFCVSSFDEETSQVSMHAPDYEAIEAVKAPAVQAAAPGVYSYCYEMQHAPTNCDFSADLSYYGKHYFLRPLHDGLPRLHGRGITYDEQRNTYCVTTRVYKQLKEQYRISREFFLD